MLEPVSKSIIVWETESGRSAKAGRKIHVISQLTIKKILYNLIPYDTERASSLSFVTDDGKRDVTAYGVGIVVV